MYNYLSNKMTSAHSITIRLATVLLLIAPMGIAGCGKSEVPPPPPPDAHLETVKNAAASEAREAMRDKITVFYGGLIPPNEEYKKGAVKFAFANDGKYEIRRITFSFKLFAGGNLVYDSGGKPLYSWVVSANPWSLTIVTLESINIDSDVYHKIKTSDAISIKVEQVFPVVVKIGAAEVPLYHWDKF